MGSHVIKTIGIAGGGQLGRMLTEAAHTLGFKVVILDPTTNSPAGQIADEQIIGDYTDSSMMLSLADKSDVITFEVESVNADALADMAANGKSVHPTPQTLLTIKDKFKQKQFLVQHRIPVADFAEVSNATMGKVAGSLFGYPYILKVRSGGFDGRGNITVTSELEISSAMEKLGTNLYAEKIIPFESELAVVAARTTAGEIKVFPLVETIHKDHICHMTLAPANVTDEIAIKAHALAENVMRTFAGAGVFGIEMFMLNDDLLINEIAPRVHNSGHWTIEGCDTSQFEQHIRAITGMPLGSVTLQADAVVMVNIIGERNAPADIRGQVEAEMIEGVKIHMYGKMETRIKRKMGHITAIANSLEKAKHNALRARSLISI